MTATGDRSSAVDPLRMLLAIFVIGIHTGFPDILPEILRQTLLNGIYRLAVPVFALISGYFFLDAVRSGREGLFLRRILTLYGLWMAIYLTRYLPVIDTFEDALSMAFFGYFHLWYLPGILIAAVILAGLVRMQVSPRAIAVGAVVLAAIGLGLQFVVLSGLAELDVKVFRNGVFFVFPYFAIGYLLAMWRKKRDDWQPGGLMVTLALALVMGESLIWYAIAGNMSGVENMASLLIAAPVLFLAALGTPGWENGRHIAGMAAFTYFFHVHMMFTATRLGISDDAKFLFVTVACVALYLAVNAIQGRRLLRAIT
ncbi:acyltransferase family protein [Paracoccus caeni]|uniref:Acyltransferase family protein n=1 Tax=Paracoccus caeni TaxID=657651 RepID=A0A934VZ28_9RHOB|nr:acyltransferase family protein [Paracoccus caeni]MBK4216617.1 acyltransferase family protein [Paracoccus caeni]